MNKIQEINKNTIISKLPCVYFLSTQDFTYIKIGQTKSIKQRIINIQSGCPFKLFLWQTIRTPNPKEIESYLHSKYKGFNIRGEWFTFDNKAIDEISLFVQETNLNIRQIKNALL